ncbi:single-stranded-DNA-specific exonuclease RecJ [Bacteroidales bacterium]|nr:single-stranded-DNA-specific exonuclease RecJ [Bacteroidales bacterium]
MLWKIKARGAEDKISHLSEVLGINDVLSNLLVQRGIYNYDDAKSFFRPSLDDLHDPFLMLDMDKAVSRIEKAIANKEKVLIYGDYDVDGTTSVALMYSFLEQYFEDINYYIPDRYGEGYGISYKGIDYASENDISLVIALDCGIKATDKIEYAKEKGIDFIICDHHNPGDTIPAATAVLDPKRPDCEYPFKELSGCGVGFKLIHAFAIKNAVDMESVYLFLDLVVVSIASDIVPVIGENRILAHFGLKFLNSKPRVGLQTIIDIAGCTGRILKVEDIVFKIGPRINAAGRMETGHQAVDLLMSTQYDAALQKAEQIDTYNTQRRDIDHDITEEALNVIAGDPKQLKKKTTVLFNPTWHKGVVGIVASRLIDKHYRPTIVLTESNGFATGSARSVANYDLYSAISECSDLLESFGGHQFAAGLTLKVENLSKFQKKFEAIVDNSIRPDQLIPQIEIDTEIHLDDINQKFYKILKQFEPFGPGNMNPVFFSENLADNGEARLVGVNKEHLKLGLIHESDPFKKYPAIAFNQPKHYKIIKKGHLVDVAYHITENDFMGKTTIQLNVKDIKSDN